MSGATWRLVFAVTAGAALSAFQHGYNTGVLNTPQREMMKWLQTEALTANQTLKAHEDPQVTAVWSLCVSIYCVGGCVGGLLCGLLADRFGRKGGLLLNNVLVFAGAALEGGALPAASAHLLVLGRFVIGVNSGLNAGLAPLYLAEISPVRLRGSLGCVYQLVITVSILVSQVLGLPWALGTSQRWAWLLGAPAVVALLQCVMLPFAPESPRYLLLNRGQEVKAQRALSWLRGEGAVHAEMEDMHQEAERSKVSKIVTLRSLFTTSHLRQPMIIALVCMVAQQLSGINAVIFFSTDIFSSAHLSADHAQYASLGMGAMNVLMTVVSLWLVERAGRRPLLLGGLAGMLLCSVGLAAAVRHSEVWWVSYVCVALVVLFVASFAIGPGPVPWFLATELFGQAARPAATAVAVAVNWLANFIVGLSFLPLSLLLETNVFIIFAVLQAVFLLFLRAKMPETRGRSHDEIQAMFRQHL